MNADDPYLATVDGAIRLDRSAWFEHRQIQRMRMMRVHTFANENCIAVPADAARPDVKRHRVPRRISLDQRCWQTALARSEPPVRLLQSDDIGVDFIEHGEDSVRIALLVKSDAFMDVVSCNF